MMICMSGVGVADVVDAAVVGGVVGGGGGGVAYDVGVLYSYINT